jgi:hypothetical protein
MPFSRIYWQLIMRSAAAGLFAALATLGARADAPAPAPPDLDAEISWARANWSPDFEGLHFHAPLAELRAWVARGPVPLYLFNDDFACRAATLSPYRASPGDADAPARKDEDASASRAMTAKIVGPPRVIVSPRSLSGHSFNRGSRPVTCHDPCPKYPESASVKRLHALSARVSLWRAQKEPLSAVPNRYKSREDCLREHPQADRARTR